MTAKQEAAQARQERRIMDFIAKSQVNTMKQAALDFYNPDALRAAQKAEQHAARIISQREKGFITFFEAVRLLAADNL